MIGLDELLAGAAPGSRDEALALMGLIAAAQIKLTAFIADSPESAIEDRLLNIDDTAARLGESKQWLYRRTAKLPFVVRVGSHVRFSSHGIDQFIARRGSR